MSDRQSTPGEDAATAGVTPGSEGGPELGSIAATSGGGRLLAASLARRRLLVKTSAVAGSAAIATHYVKPSLQALGVPTALAVSGPKEKWKKEKKHK